MTRSILVGVTGGIAAYKSLSLIRLLTEAGHQVKVIPTETALKFIGKTSFEALSGHEVITDLHSHVPEVPHVKLGQEADLLVIAPATANTLAKITHGFADDLLTNTVLTTTAPILLAPAMHTEMWENASTAENIRILKERGYLFVGPESGRLTGKDTGVGRMSEAETIFACIEGILSGTGQSATELPGNNKRVLITAGGTREAIDPVRFIGNRSSGKQGIALAYEAVASGAAVTLLAANISEDLSGLVAKGVQVVPVSDTYSLAQELDKHAPESDVVIMAAAVSDYRVKTSSDAKIKKESHRELTLDLIQNPDLLKKLVENKSPEQIIVGFAAETATGEELLQLGREKLARKGCDFLVVNEVGWNTGIEADTNRVLVLNAFGDVISEAEGTKMSIASSILNTVW